MKESFVVFFFMGLSLNIQKNNGPKTIDLTPAVTDFTQVVKDWPAKTATMDVRVRYVKRTELPEFVFPNGEKPKVPKRRRREREVIQDPEENKSKKQKVETTEQNMEMESKSIESVLNAEVEMSTTAGPESIDISMENGDQRPLKVSKSDENLPENGKHESIDLQTTTTTRLTTPTSENILNIEQPIVSNVPKSPPKSPPKPERSQSLELELSNITEMTNSRPTISKKPTINLLK